MKLLIKLVTLLLYIEHFIYCATDCKVELPLHKRYYQHRREVYESYREALYFVNDWFNDIEI